MCQVCISDASSALREAGRELTQARQVEAAERESMPERDQSVLAGVTSHRQARAMGVCMRDAFEARERVRAAERRVSEMQEWYDRAERAGDSCAQW